MREISGEALGDTAPNGRLAGWRSTVIDTAFTVNTGRCEVPVKAVRDPAKSRQIPPNPTTLGEDCRQRQVRGRLRTPPVSLMFQCFNALS